MPERMSEKDLNQLISMLEWEPSNDTQLSDAFLTVEQALDDYDGRLLVRADKIFVQDPLPGGSPAVISAVLPVVIQVNGEKISSPTEVTSDDTIE